MAGAVIALDQLGEVFSTIYPVQPGNLQWRFGTLGLLLGRATPMVIADAFIVAGAAALGHVTFLRIWGILHLVLALLLLGALGLFALDAVQIRSLVPPDGHQRLTLATARAAGGGLLAIAVAVVLGIVCLKQAASARNEARQRAGRKSADALIVGQGS
ncbi:MAG: hypothetical protein ACOY71_04300 [Gemmatimonadota bacterium]